ncbi:MAG: pilin [Patescibacteria group bacterium]|nr:pilin [Patescibacteria group bacterium]
MKLLKTIALTILLLTLFNLSYAQQQQVGKPEQLTTVTVPDKFLGCDPGQDLTVCVAKIFSQILSLLLFAAIILATIWVVYAGIVYIVGSEDSKKKAKNNIIYAAVGLVIAFAGWVLVRTFTRYLGGIQ